MEANKCKICGERHWGPLCRGVVKASAQSPQPKLSKPQAVKMIAPVDVTPAKSVDVTRRVDVTEMETLRAENKMLKQALASRGGECQVCKARREAETARQRRWRSKEKSDG